MVHKTILIKNLFISIVYFFSAIITLQAQAFYWVKNITVNNISSENNKIVRTIIDNGNNIWTIGNFSDIINFTNFYYAASGGTDFFVAKLNDNGDIIKTVIGSGSGTSLISDIAIDSMGNIYLTGLFKGELNLLDSSIVNNSDYKVFLIKISNTQTVSWIKELTSSFNVSRTPHVTVDSENNPVITGPFVTTLTGDGIELNTPGITNPSIYIIKYSRQGLPIYARAKYDSSGDTFIATSIASDNSGNVYITGNARTGWYTSRSNYFLYKYNSNGNIVWEKYGSSSASVSSGKKVIVKGNYVTLIAEFELSGSSAVIKSYTLEGTDHFSTSLVTGWASLPIGLDIAMDNNFSIYAICSYNQAFYIGTTPINTIGGYDGIIVKLKTNGEIDWHSKFAGFGNDISSSINLMSNNKIIISGKCTQTASFGSFSAPASLFFAEINEPKLNITLPQENEVWQTGTKHNITWQAFTDKNINIYLSTNDGTNWITLVTNYNAKINNFNFTVPPINNADKCKIKISTYNSPELSVITDYNFSITNNWAPYIRFTSFNSNNKSICINNTTIVDWECDGLDGTVDLDISYDNGINWTSILNNLPVQNKSVSVLLQNTVSDRCRLRIKSDMISTVTDVTDELFTICNMELLSPVENQILKGGEVFQLEFTSQMVNLMNAYYSTNNGSSWNIIQEQISSGSGEISWLVPEINCDSVIIKFVNFEDTTAYRIFNTPFLIWFPISVTQSTMLGQNNINFDNANLNLSAFVMVQGEITTRYFMYEAPYFSNLPEGVLATGQFYWELTSPSVSFVNGKLSVPLNSFDRITNPDKVVWLYRENFNDNWVNLNAQIINGNIESIDYFSTLGQFTLGTTDSNNFVTVKNNELPTLYFISNNYPNPFNPITKITINVINESLVDCAVFNSLGQKVAVLLGNEYINGSRNITWNAINNSSGIYFIVFNIKDLINNKAITEIRKAVLLK